ncbi:MAG: O-methyltransferase [Candidatus Thorarchaeota archaeon]
MTKADVDYLERPNKSIVRARILDAIEQTFHPEHRPDEPLAFVSFSGYQFIDAIGFYNRFGIRNIFSIEYNERLYRRSLFNIPYGFFSVTNGRVTQFIDECLREIADHKKVIYLDYECRFSDIIIEDLEALFSSAFFDEKGLLFMTFNTGFDRSRIGSLVSEIVPEQVESRQAFEGWLNEDFGSYILDKTQRRYQSNKVVTEIIKALYRDTSNMVVLGYLIDDSDDEEITLVKGESEEFRLPVLTFMETNYIRNNLDDSPSDIAERIGLLESDVRAVLENI